MQEIEAYLKDAAASLPHETDTQLLRWLRSCLEAGIPPYDGGAMQQPNHFVEDMKYLNTLEYYHDLPRLLAECEEGIKAAKAAMSEEMRAAKKLTN